MPLTEVKRNKILILGIGNILLNDEGVGIHLISKLEREGFADADLMDGGTGGFNLLGVIQSYERVIFVDASFDTYPPGTVRVMHPRYANDFPHRLSAHEIGLKDLIDAVFLLGNEPRIYLIAIAIRDFQKLGTKLTPDVERAIPDAIKKIKKLLNSFQTESVSPEGTNSYR